jgi:hypothetical protein
MKSPLILSMSIVVALLVATTARAEVVPLTSGGVPAGSLTYTRTVYNSSMDEIDVHIATWIAGNGLHLHLLEGTWTALYPEYVPGGMINLGGNAITWKALTANNGTMGRPAPQSYINLDTITGAATWARTGSGLVNSSLTGSWYTSDLEVKLGPETPNLPDFDNSLLAKIYVSTGAGVAFMGNPQWGGWGFELSTTRAGGFAIPGVPEPSTIALALTALTALVSFACVQARTLRLRTRRR